MEEEELVNSSPNNFKKPSPSNLANKITSDKKNATPMSLYSNVINNNRFYNTDYGKSKYDEKLNFETDINTDNVNKSLNEFRSQQQGGWGELGAGLGRVGSKVTREVLKTAGAIAGTAWGLAGNAADMVTGEDNTDLLKDAFDNSFIRAVDENFNKFNNAALPVYVSDTVTNGGFFNKITSGEFWATEGADGAGYLISAFAPGAALKALGASNKLFGGLAKLTSMRYGKSLDVSRRALLQAGITVDKIDSFAIPAANTFFEAGAESKGVTDSMEARFPEFEKGFPEYQLKKLQEVDERRQRGEISVEEANQLSNDISNRTAREEYDDQKSKAARNTFLTNLLILAGPNYIQSKIMYGKNGSTNLLNNVTKKNGLKQAGKRLGESFLTEGSEEVAQTSTEQRNAEKGFKGELSDTFAQDMDPFTFGKDFIKSLGTTEGQVAGFLGGMLGAPISIVQGFRQDKKDQVKSDKLRSKIETTGVSLNDIHLPIYKTEVMTNPETGEETEVYSQDDKGQKVLIPENVQKVKHALDLHEGLSKRYDAAVEAGDVDTIDSLRKYGEHELIMNFIGEDEMTIDALQEHLKVTLPTTDVDAKTKSDNLKRQTEIIEKAKYLQKELVSFRDMSTSIVKLNNEKATPDQVSSFMEQMSKEFIKETSEVYDNQKRLDKLNKDKADLEKLTIVEEVDNTNFEEFNSNEADRTTTTRSNPRLDLVNKKIAEVKKELSDASKLLNFEIWNSEIVNGAFNQIVNAVEKLETATSPEVVDEADNILNAIQAASTLEELDAIDLKNNLGYKGYYNTKKIELQAAKAAGTVKTIEEEEAERKAAELEAAENATIVKNYAKTSKIGNVELDPFTLEESIITHIEKNSITLANAVTGESFTYEFEEDLNDDNSADDIDPTKVSVVPAGSTHSDHKGVGYDNNNPTFAGYLMEARDKKGDVITFELNELNLSPEGQKAVDIIKNSTNLIGNRQLLIDTLPITFVYNNGQAKSWSSFKGPNAIKLRTNIVDAIINGAKLSELKTVVTNQESASFNTKFENGKPVINNPLEIDFIKTLDESNPENKVTLYHVNVKGDLVIVSNNKLPLEAEIKKDISTQKGQIFIVVKNPKGVNVPVKLNFSKLNATKASTLARLYGKMLTDTTIRSKNLISLKSSDLGLFNEILSSFKDELELLGGNPATINISEVIQALVYEDSMNDKAIVFTNDIENNPAILFDGTLYNNDNIDELGVALQSKYHNVITIAKEKNANENLSFKNPIYLKYLFDNGIVSTNLNTDGFAFKQFTDTKAGDKAKNTGSELWISSVVESTGAKAPVTTTLAASNTSTVEQLRAEEQVKKADIEQRRDKELVDRNANWLLPVGIDFNLRENKSLLERKNIQEKVNAKYDVEQKQLYDEYDEKISPLLKSEKAGATEVKPAITAPVVNTMSKQDLIKSKIAEYNKLVTYILSKRKEGQDTIKGPDYLVNELNEIVENGTGIYTDEGFNPGDGLETYDVIKEFISETIENNYNNILQSQKNVVSLPTITLTNTINTPGTQDNLDYKKAFNNLKVEGDNLLLQEGLERTLNVAIKNAEMFRKTNPSVVSKFEKIISETEAKLIELADNIKKQQKC
jgi:hypothetical protein